ncbi:MAG: adenylyl-sulfate kinase [Flavobacteriales bacterium]
MTNTIFPVVTDNHQNELILNQRGVVVWLVGLSGSGKSTLAGMLRDRLHTDWYITTLLDGDNLRSGINRDLGFSETDRLENIRRTAEVAKLFADAGIVTICSLITPSEEMRQLAKSIIGEERYFEVFVDASLETCEQRDVKGLYKRARAGEVASFTGVQSKFERPSNPFLTIQTEQQNVDACFAQLWHAVENLIDLESENEL